MIQNILGNLKVTDSRKVIQLIHVMISYRNNFNCFYSKNDGGISNGKTSTLSFECHRDKENIVFNWQAFFSDTQLMKFSLLQNK